MEDFIRESESGILHYIAIIGPFCFLAAHGVVGYLIFFTVASLVACHNLRNLGFENDDFNI